MSGVPCDASPDFMPCMMSAGPLLNVSCVSTDVAVHDFTAHPWPV
jgi:hypothetical protein